jgi:transcriptional regulator
VFIPKVFNVDCRDQMFALIKEHPLATLVCNTKAGLEANHLPMLVEERDGKTLLIGHIAKANPLHQNIANGSEVLVTFQGPQAYVSASYYPNIQRDHKVVPTWNYTAVHVSGRLEFTHNKEELLAIVDTLTQTQEQSRKQPWKVSDAPREYIDRMLNAIVGIRVSIEGMQGKWKVSQNHSDENRQGLIKALRAEGNQAMAQTVALKSSEN